MGVFSCTFRLAEYLESEPERLAAQAEAQKAKREVLERKLGINNNAASSSLSAAKPSVDYNPPPFIFAGKKHRFDDSDYLEQSREISKGVRNAVSSALLKKRKKVKVSSGGYGAGEG